MKLQFKLVIFLIFIALVFVCIYQGYWLYTLYNDQYAKMEVDILTAMRNADDQSVYWERGKRKTADFDTYNNFLQSELIQKGINVISFIEIFDLQTQAIKASIPADTSGIDRSEYKSYDFPFDIKGKYAYRLNIKQPNIFILKQMSGILFTFILLIFLMFISYFYLLRTIFRQKTLDEIKSDFVNNMTHELKTPISVAYTANDALLNYNMIDDPEKREKYLHISQEQLMHLTGLVEQILTMSVEERKNLRLSLESIQLKTLFEALKNQYTMQASKETEIIVDVQPEILCVEADKVHFQNVICNLIENALKYSGKTVNILLKAENKGDNVRISVSDNGNGIPSSSIPKIFDKFYRVPTGNLHDVKGYGLGLSYVKTIMEKHHGTVSVVSREGEGSTFYLDLPGKQL